MDRKLFFEAISKVALGFVVMAALLFLPAGSLGYRRGWLLLAILFIPMVCAGFVMMARCPELLRKRLHAKEEQNEQKAVVALSAGLFLLCFVLAGLGFRFGWYMLPRWVSYAAAAVFLLAYVLYAEVLRENEYLSRTVEVQQGQKVIDTGLYGVVRHPMYMATVLLFLAMPLVLGAPISFALMLLYIPIIAKRIRNEEEVLTAGLAGYAAYKERVRYRLIPFIW